MIDPYYTHQIREMVDKSIVCHNELMKALNNQNSSMKEFYEMQKLINDKTRVSEFIERVKTTSLQRDGSIIIANNYNNRYTFREVETIIGEDKMQSIISQFEGLINLELQRKKEEIESCLSLYSVKKEETCSGMYFK